MRPDEIKQEIPKPTLVKKILLVAEVCDSIAESQSLPPMPERQKIELTRRYAAYSNHQLSLHDWQVVHDDLRNKYE